MGRGLVTCLATDSLLATRALTFAMTLRRCRLGMKRGKLAIGLASTEPDHMLVEPRRHTWLMVDEQAMRMSRAEASSIHLDTATCGGCLQRMSASFGVRKSIC